MTFVLYFMYIASGVPQYSEMGKYPDLDSCNAAGAAVVKAYSGLKYNASFVCLQRNYP